MSSNQPKVFISYAREDTEFARRLFGDLKEAGVAPWLDKEDLLPGQKWEPEIEKALKETDFVIALLSSRSLRKRGYIQKELRYALSVLDLIPEGQVFLIPARLDDCDPVHDKLKEINWVDLFPSYDIGLEKILRVVRPERLVKTGAFDSSFVADASDLSQAGWGVIFPRDTDPAIREALSPLLSLRKAQATAHDERLYREFAGPTGYQPGEAGLQFLIRSGMGPGTPDPKRVPSYLLIVGDPDTIPFTVEYDLGVQYEVGRIAFDRPEQYAQYAQNVLDVENRKIAAARRVAFFNVTHEGDSATETALKQLTNPVFEALRRQHPGWQHDRIVGQQASRMALKDVLSSPQRPSMLFVASHSLQNGALLCADWAGVGHSQVSLDNHCFTAHDIDPIWDLRGLVVWLFSGAGWPASSDFAWMHGRSDGGSGRASISELPMALLGRSNGALGVIGHIDTPFSSSFTWPRVGTQTQGFESALHSILRGKPLAAALRYFRSRYAELAIQYLQKVQAGETAQRDTELLRIAMTDARNYVLIGDPAAALRL